MYFHSEPSASPTVTILGNGIQRDSPVSRLDDTCQVYYGLVAAEASETVTSRTRVESLLRELRHGPGTCLEAWSHLWCP